MPARSLAAIGVSALLLVGLAAGPAVADLPGANAVQKEAADAVLSGTVALRDADEEHPAPADPRFELRVQDAAGAQVALVETGPDFSVAVPGGEPLTLRATLIGSDDWYPTWYGDTPIADSAKTTQGPDGDLTITLPRTAALSGSVSADAIAGVSSSAFTVQAWWADGGTYTRLASIPATGAPDAARAWSTGELPLPAGDYLLRLVEPGYPAYDDQYFSRLARLDERAVVSVPPGGRSDVDFFPSAYASDTARLAGTDRYATAVAVTASAFTDAAPVVYLASGANWPDALSAGPAAAKQGGALLLTDPNVLPDVVAAELRRLAPQRIVVVGSSLSVSDAVFEQVAALGIRTDRIAGTDRYDTSRRIVEDAFPAGSYPDVFLATGTSFPDALSVAPIAGRREEPVLLVDGARSRLDQATRDSLARLDPVAARLLGGAPSISTGVEADLRAAKLADTVSRIAGVDRHDTSRLLNDAFPPSDLTDTVYLATATGFADALAVGPVAARQGAALYLSEPTCLPRTTRVKMQSHDLDQVLLLGSPLTLSAQVQSLTAC
ncbi:cell wall-binding repeat-containing protein [Rathayibacter tritici]|uniref:cell wall-binding repeat-containing protein n=1 Tax=Rathayibacter tritici TaxID=33888 RepID=UPI0011B08DB0|nr:cell wall-binding repeat-containing protein [Rathayibacter tritici]